MTSNHHSRRQFMKQALQLFALSSTFMYAQNLDAWNATPTKRLEQLFQALEPLTSAYLQGNISGMQWIDNLDHMMKTNWNANTKSDLLTLIDFERISRTFNFTDKGRASYEVQTPIIYTAEHQKINTKIIGISQGHNIPPHAHDCMGSASIVLSGKVRIRNYERIENTDNGMIIKPIADQIQTAGQWSSISDSASNIHWFNTIASNVFLLNINVEGIGGKARPGIRIDPEIKNAHTGFIKANLMSNTDAEEKYG